MTLAALKTKANTKLQEFWVVLSAKQEQYFIRYQDYFQLLVTEPVVDGADTVFTLTLPSDQQPRSKDYTFDFNSPIPFQIEVNCFGNDVEKGYEVVVVVELPDGRKFTRSRTLTDTRTVTQDFDNTDEFNPIPVGDRYAVGTDPVIETTEWTEIIEEQL